MKINGQFSFYTVIIIESLKCIYIYIYFSARNPARRNDTSVHAITSPERVIKSRPRGSSQSQRNLFSLCNLQFFIVKYLV